MANRLKVVILAERLLFRGCYGFNAPPQRTAKGGLGIQTPPWLVRTPVRLHPAHAGVAAQASAQTKQRAVCHFANLPDPASHVSQFEWERSAHARN